MRRSDLSTIISSSALIPILSLFLVGCAVSSATISTYVEPGFNPSSITRIAVFPMRNAMIAPGQAEALDSAVAQAVKQRRPSIVIVSPTEATKVLNEKGLADKWAQFIDNYKASGIPNAALLREIGDSLGVDAIIQGEINNIQQVNGAFASNKGVTFVAVHYFMMGVQSSTLLWQASSDALRTTTTTVEDAPPIIQAIQLAQQKIVTTLPF